MIAARSKKEVVRGLGTVTHVVVVVSFLLEVVIGC